MPRIPEYYTREPFPTTGGMPRSTVRVPVVSQPTADMHAGTLLERAVGDLGGALQTSAEAVVRSEERAAQVRKAQDTLDAATQDQRFQQRFVNIFDQISQGEYQTMPDEVQRQGTELINELAAPLNPQTRAMFTAKANQALTLYKWKAEVLKTARRDQHTIFTTLQAVQEFQEAYMRAENDFERAYHKESLTNLLSAFADTGLMKGDTAATILSSTLKTAAVERWYRHIELDPPGTYLQLQKGPAEHPDIPISEFDNVLKRAGEHGVKRAQEDEYTKLTVSLSAAQLPEIPDLLALAGQKAVKRAITGEQYDKFRSHVFEQERRLRNPVPVVVDDPKVVDLYNRELARSGKTGEEIDTLSSALAREPALSGETVRKMQEDLTRQREAGYYLNRRSFGEGKDYIEKAILPQINQLVAQFTGRTPAQEEAAQTYALALASYRRRMENIWRKEPPDVFDELAYGAAREVVSIFGKLPGQALGDLPSTVVAPLPQQNTLSADFQAMALKYRGRGGCRIAPLRLADDVPPPLHAHQRIAQMFVDTEGLLNRVACQAIRMRLQQRHDARAEGLLGVRRRREALTRSQPRSTRALRPGAAGSIPPRTGRAGRASSGAGPRRRGGGTCEGQGSVVL